jgi:FkbH-like protein
VIKCVVWDLDDTLWHGTLLEGEVSMREDAKRAIEALDARGVLCSIASKNEAKLALQKLESLGLADYFLHPQISWEPKSGAVARIAEALNIGIDAVAFVDDQPFERDEVRFHHPEVMCFDAADLTAMLAHEKLSPEIVTDEARMRRKLYQADLVRAQAESSSGQPHEEFLATLGMELTIRRAGADDLPRVAELVSRTHQLNTTGRIYSYAELEQMRSSPDHVLLVASLSDVYGPYGTIGLALLDRSGETYTIRLLLMSCRVMSRGVGAVLVNVLRRMAREEGMRLRADFVPTDKNRMMYMTYKFSGFRELSESPALILLEADPDAAIGFPDYVSLRVQ